MIGILIGVRYAQIQKRDCEVISSAGIERPGESERALTCIASESAGQEDAQRARIVLPEGTDVPSPSWPAGLAGHVSDPALSTACFRGPSRKHQGVVRVASSQPPGSEVQSRRSSLERQVVQIKATM